ncbi:hypothetical protein B0H13DRAFT_2304093 [Mycena leptocephala]|nr:hypothetical protein B0H13DRAFT_2304093 [Mycena leptocephala]
MTSAPCIDVGMTTRRPRVLTFTRPAAYSDALQAPPLCARVICSLPVSRTLGSCFVQSTGGGIEAKGALLGEFFLHRRTCSIPCYRPAPALECLVDTRGHRPTAQALQIVTMSYLRWEGVREKPEKED